MAFIFVLLFINKFKMERKIAVFLFVAALFLIAYSCSGMEVEEDVQESECMEVLAVN